jgi:ATP-dependent DNA helicase RecQ
MIQDFDERRAKALLHSIAGPGTAFHDGQLEAIAALVRGRQRVLIVQRTGWGKSAVYFIPTRMLRDHGAGPTLLISPLLALMRNQILMGHRSHVVADTINSSNREEHARVIEELTNNRVDLLLVSPERLNNPAFRSELLPAIARKTGLIVIDEAHCISDWGHDFRPDYRRVRQLLQTLPQGVPVLATTATANDRVIVDIQEQMGIELLTQRGSLDRESLELHVVIAAHQAQRLAWLAHYVPSLPNSGIVYCLTIRDARRVAAWLRSQGIEALSYTGSDEAEYRIEVETALLDNRVKVVCATSALGMGFDKPDVGFVVHFQAPGSPITYYQQVGRAGRALDRSFGVLLSGAEDREIQDFFIESAFPPQPLAEEVLSALESSDKPLSVTQLCASVNARQTRMKALLKILEVEGAVTREGSRYTRTANPWSYNHERVRWVTQQRRHEQDEMAHYLRTEGCLMEFLRDSLDDAATEPCGRCMNCAYPIFAEAAPRHLTTEATRFLRRSDDPIEPRKRWPTGLEQPSGRIPVELLNEPGRTLSMYNDGGWGWLVRKGKFEDGRFDGQLVAASRDLIVERWHPVPASAWVTCVPSYNHPRLVPSFATRLAATLRLPFRPVVVKVRDTRPQKEMENSAQQVKNIWGAFTVRSPLPSGPVLLIDDMVDSGWTLTVVGAALKEAGSGPVYPFALARSTGT